MATKRNYKREAELQKEKLKRIEIRVDKKLGEDFVSLLEKQGISRNEWGTKQIEKYLKKYEEKA